MKYFILLLTLILLIGCAGSGSSRGKMQAEQANIESADLVGWMDNPSAVYALDESEIAYETGGGGAYNRASMSKSLAAPMAVAGMESYEPPPNAKPQQRMVNYNGEIHLQSAEPEAVIDTVVQRAVAKGGSVNVRRNGFVSLQIPIAEFKPFFEYILTLGRITDKNIFANDITEAFTDNAERLRIAENTLARFQELLAQAKTELEKLTLLKEIQKLSEQIEQMKLTEKELLKKAQFSTITLWASNIPTHWVRPLKLLAFVWLDFLPEMECTHIKDGIEINASKDFIQNKEEYCFASALNSELLAFERENDPQGTPDFWKDAMMEYFKNQYSVQKEDSYIRLQTFEPEPRIIYISILKSSTEKKLKIAIAKFPNKEAEDKDSASVINVFKEAK